MFSRIAPYKVAQSCASALYERTESRAATVRTGYAHAILRIALGAQERGSARCAPAVQRMESVSARGHIHPCWRMKSSNLGGCLSLRQVVERQPAQARPLSRVVIVLPLARQRSEHGVPRHRPDDAATNSATPRRHQQHAGHWRKPNPPRTTRPFPGPPAERTDAKSRRVVEFLSLQLCRINNLVVTCGTQGNRTHVRSHHRIPTQSWPARCRNSAVASSLAT